MFLNAFCRSSHYQAAYDVLGKGLPVLCCAGFGCSNWIFEDLSKALANSFTWVMPDSRGMGQSPEVTQPYAIEDLAEDSLEVMDHLGFEKFAVIGISMGGFAAQVLALQYPERIKGLGLFCTTGPGQAFRPMVKIEAQQLRDAYEADPHSVATANTLATVYPGFREREPQRFEAIVNWKLKHRAALNQVLLQRQATLNFLETALPLHDITCPTLIMTGAQDRFVPPENSILLAQTIPNSELHILEQSDHLFFLEKAPEVARVSRSFLEQL